MWVLTERPKTHMEKILLLTLLRRYRYMEGRSPLDLSTIVDAQGWAAFLGTFGLMYRLPRVWGILGLTLGPSHPAVSYTTSFFPLGRVRIISKKGPFGDRLYSRVLDLYSVCSSPFWIVLLWLFQKGIEPYSDKSDPHVLQKSLWKVYHHILQEPCRPLFEAIRQKGVTPSYGKLSHFGDGLGKTRYIAVGN